MPPAALLVLVVISSVFPTAKAFADASSVPATNLAMVDIGGGPLGGIDLQNAGSSSVTNDGIVGAHFVAYDAQGDVAYDASGESDIVITSGHGGASRTISDPGYLGDTEQALFDSSGDLYYLSLDDTNGSGTAPAHLMEVPDGANTAQVVTTPPLCYIPVGLGLDNSGDFYISCGFSSPQDTLQDTLLELKSGASSFATIDSGLSDPFEITLDSSGNVYLADPGANAIYEYADNTSHTRSQPVDGVAAASVAVDTYGNLYAIDESTNEVDEYPADSAGVVVAGTAPIVVSSGYQALREVVAIPPPPVAPGAPIIGTAVGGDGQAQVTFSPPAASGGAPVTGYTVTPIDQTTQSNGTTVSGSSSPITVTGLTDGDSYTFTVTATNSAGTGASSAPTNAVTPSSANPTFYVALPAIGQVVKVAPDGTQSTITSAAPSEFTGIAVDGSGTTYEADAHFDRVVEVSSGGEESIPDIRDLDDPTDVKVDSSGTLYVLDRENGRIEEFHPDNTQTTLVGGLETGVQMALDSAGNVYIPLKGDPADPHPGDNTIIEVAPDGSQTTRTTSGLNGPAGIAVDPSGNLFIADTGNNRVVELAPDGTQTTVPTQGLSGPEDVAVDAAGNLFISDSNNDRVVKVTPSGTQTTVATFTTAPYEVAFPPVPTAPTLPGAPTVLTAAGGGAQATVSFIPPFSDGGSPITSYTATAQDVTTPGNGGQSVSGASSPITVTGLTNGDDYTFTVTATNAEGTGPASSPSGAITPTGPTEDLYVADFADNRVLELLPDGSLKTIGQGLYDPEGIAVDASGDVFISDAGHQRVVEVAPDGTQTVVASGFEQPIGVAVDPSGNVYVCDPSVGTVFKVDPSGVKSTFVSGLNAPLGVGTDASGNVYIADSNDSLVIKVTPSGTQSDVGTGWVQPWTVTADGSGNLFVPDNLSDQVIKVAPSGAQTVIGQGLGNPDGVAIDGAGNAFISDYDNGDVVEVTPSGVQTTILTGLKGPYGLAGAPASAVVIPGPPTITSVSPSSGSTSGGTTVTVSGSGFTGATGVYFGGIAGTHVTVVNDNTLTVTSPGNSAGAHAIQVATPNGISPKVPAGAFTYGAGLVVTSLSPASGSTAGGTSVTLTGTGFTGATSVVFGGIPAKNVAVVNDTTITLTSPSDTAGAHSVQVITPTGTSAKTTQASFTYIGPPVVTSLSPSSGPTAGGTNITVTGTGFTGATAVYFGGLPAKNLVVVNDTTLTVTSPSDSAGGHGVQVTTPSGLSPKVSGGTFTYVGPPVVTSLSPSSGPTAGGTSITVTGTGFTGATSVIFGGIPGANVVVVNDTTLTVTSPNNSAGAHSIQVTTPNGTSPKVAGGAFTYVAPPVVTAVNPNAGPKAGGTSITITGTGFTGATAVLFGGIPGKNLVVVSDTTITVTSPNNSAGAHSIQVTTPDGTSPKVTASNFTYT